MRERLLIETPTTLGIHGDTTACRHGSFGDSRVAGTDPMKRNTLRGWCWSMMGPISVGLMTFLRTSFVGYLNTVMPEEEIKERMAYFRDQAKQLMEIRKSGHLSEDKV